MSTSTNDRAVSAANAGQLTATLVRPVFLVSLAFANETVYAWTGVGNLVWEGNTYLGVGQLGNVSPIVEGSEVSAQGITLTLSGIPANLLSDSLTEIQAGNLAQVYLGFVDQNGVLVDDPIPAFIGLLDQPTIDASTDTATIAITVENRMSDMNRARGGRYTDQDQRSRYPNDGSLKYVHFLQDSRIGWN
jgi:hypothetical protein